MFICENHTGKIKIPHLLLRNIEYKLLKCYKWGQNKPNMNEQKGLDITLQSTLANDNICVFLTYSVLTFCHINYLNSLSKQLFLPGYMSVVVCCFFSWSAVVAVCLSFPLLCFVCLMIRLLPFLRLSLMRQKATWGMTGPTWLTLLALASNFSPCGKLLRSH